MDLFPAIDLQGGKVVRLSQGDPARATIYAADPAAQALAFLEAGARWLHVVDLDRAFGTGENIAAVAAVVRRAGDGARIQCGGGLRSLDAIEAALGAGVSRAVIGTAAVTDPGLVEQAVARWGSERVAVGLDVRRGVVAIRGWGEASGVPMLEAARRAAGAGVETIVYTDIERDGMLRGPDLQGCQALGELGVRVVASGGIASLADIVAVSRSGCAGAIVGRALYEGRVDLAQAIVLSGERRTDQEMT